MRLLVCSFLFPLLVACGSSPLVAALPADGGAHDGGPVADGGAALGDGGIGGAADGGSSTDGGGLADGGVLADGGGTDDAGSADDGGSALDDGGSALDDGGSALDAGSSPDGGAFGDAGSLVDAGPGGGACGPGVACEPYWCGCGRCSKEQVTCVPKPPPDCPLACPVQDCPELAQTLCDCLDGGCVKVRTGCVSSDECSPGQSCCYPCGIPGCVNECMEVGDGGCPLFAAPGG